MKQNKKTVLTIGGATYDIFIHYEDSQKYLRSESYNSESYTLLQQGVKIDISDLHYASGGGATNSAYHLKNLGFTSHAFFKIARDQEGRFILDELNNYGIYTTTVSTTSELKTGTSFIIPASNGNSTILAYRGANSTLEESDLPHEILKNTDGVYITSLSGDSSKILQPITQHAQNTHTLVACNPGKSQLINDTETLKNSLQNIDLFILNAHEAQTLFSTFLDEPESKEDILKRHYKNTVDLNLQLCRNFLHKDNYTFSIKDYCKEILYRGPQIVVVTNGSEGVYVATDECLYFHKALDTDVANTVGAGDSFGSCFFGSILAGYEVKTALIFGILNSASVLGTPDAKTGSLTFTQLKKQAALINSDYLKIFYW